MPNPTLAPGDSRAVRVIFHVDMDAFFASVEQRDQPEYRGHPVIVGSPPDRRGVVCAASYEARKFGVRSAMPSRTAGRLCPQGIFVRPRMDVYRAESSQIMQILGSVTSRIEKISVDEAFLDVSEAIAPELIPDGTGGEVRPIEELIDTALKKAEPIAQRIKAEILEKRDLTASIGVASNKFLAKLGSDYQKPDGLTVIAEATKASFLRPLSVAAIHGVGPVTARALSAHDILTIGDIQDTQMELRRVVGSFAERLKQLAVGEDYRPVETGDERKSISSETTFLEDTADRPTLRAALKELAADVAHTLEQDGLGALTIHVKVRYSDFRTITRQIRMEEPLMTAPEIYRLACYLLARDRLVSRPLRLLGLGVSTLSAPSTQLRLPM